MPVVCKDCRRLMDPASARTPFGYPLTIWRCNGCGRSIEELPSAGDGNSYK